jgi:hypothetical protein
MPRPSLPKLLAAAALALPSIACLFLQGAVPQASGPSETAPKAAGSQTVSDETVEEVTDPRVEAALGLRSVRMELRAEIPNEAAERIQVVVDAAGNVRIETSLPVFEDSMVTPESPDWNVFEIFVVDGKGYTRSGKSGGAEPDPQQNNALRDMLYGPNGPGIWLMMVPEDDITQAGRESLGGFEALKFHLASSLELGDIQGELWVDETTGALVAADLSIAERYFRPMDESANGTAAITFAVEKAEVPSITVP